MALQGLLHGLVGDAALLDAVESVDAEGELEVGVASDVVSADPFNEDEHELVAPMDDPFGDVVEAEPAEVMPPPLFAETGTEPAAFEATDPSALDGMDEPAEVDVLFHIAQLEERTLANIPVVPLVDAGRPDVGVSPPVADVMVRGVADSVRQLTEARISLTVPVGDRPEGVYELPAEVDHPRWLTVLGVVPREFRVIVGNPPLGEPARRDSLAVAPEGDDG